MHVSPASAMNSWRGQSPSQLLSKQLAPHPQPVQHVVHALGSDVSVLHLVVTHPSHVDAPHAVGAAQAPCWHVSPVQQSVSDPHVCWAAAQHDPPPEGQVVPAQQGSCEPHVVPSVPHAWHSPSLQVFEQQSDARVHELPLAEQSPQLPS
jgi:hypothetical protein